MADHKTCTCGKEKTQVWASRTSMGMTSFSHRLASLVYKVLVRGCTLLSKVARTGCKNAGQNPEQMARIKRSVRELVYSVWQFCTGVACDFALRHQ